MTAVLEQLVLVLLLTALFLYFSAPLITLAMLCVVSTYKGYKFRNIIPQNKFLIEEKIKAAIISFSWNIVMFIFSIMVLIHLSISGN